MFCVPSYAQNVTISPQSGKLIAGLSAGNESGFENGGCSLWRHNQLPLTLTVSDDPDLTEGGLLKLPAGDLCLDAEQNLYVVHGGTSPSVHINISLPKGYRFTGYRMVLLNNVNRRTIDGQERVGMNRTMYETGSDFDYQNPKAQTDVMPSEKEPDKEYVIERTSHEVADMDNNLYFYFYHEEDEFYAATIKSCELYFTAEGDFTCDVKPASPENIIAGGVNLVGVDFQTSKLDLGEISPHTKNNKTFFSYNYQNVRELTAQNYLYQEDAVVGGKLPTTAGTGSIQALTNDGSMYFALGNNTYYIETPTETRSQDNIAIPLGYRITGAKIRYHYGTAAGETPGQIIGFYIRSGNEYLTDQGTWSTTTKTVWHRDNSGKISANGKYLHVDGEISNNSTVNLVSDESQGTAFSKSGSSIYISDGFVFNYYLSNKNGKLCIIEGASYEVYAENVLDATNPAFTPAPYTLTVYSTDKSNPFQTQAIAEGADGVIELTGLNNDAVKFGVSGLPEGAKALLTFEVTLQALNPFVNSIDIVCHSLVNNGPTLMQQFTSNDFQVSGGAFTFYVPQNFFGGGEEKCRFTFENLYSKYGDNGYTNGAGNARYFFENSPYNLQFGDGKQYEATGNEIESDKNHTEQCGNQPFKYSNIDELDNNNTSASATTLEEYPYSDALYASQGGTFTSNIELAVDEEKPCYLFTGDETRWNVAPTTAMEHRYFAYYLLDLKLETKDYIAKCELTKLYDATCYSMDGQDAELPMYGGTFKALDAVTGEEIPSGNAYLTVPMMKQALIDELYGNPEKGIAGVGATGKQVLYLDYTNLYSVHIPVKAEMEEMKGTLNPNCLIYFPERTSYNEDNYIQKTASGNYRACKNIVITDKQPFYAPYKITVPAENYATYTRMITVPKYGRAINATVILPFTLTLENGVHTNKDGSCSFTVNKMNADNAFSMDEDGTTAEFTGYFAPIEGTSTEANVPYMVKVENAPADETISFIATQYGSDVMATTKENGMNETAYTFEGESATGTIDGTTYYLTNYGSYSGKKIAKGNNIYYFAKNRYVSSTALNDSYQYVLDYPFRAYYQASTSSGAKAMVAFNVAYGDNPKPTGINDIDKKADLSVTSGQGSITFTAAADSKVDIYGANGMAVAHVAMKAGETRSIAVPSGMYIVNGVKIIVK
jgi:hypothetical protein